MTKSDESILKTKKYNVTDVMQVMDKRKVFRVRTLTSQDVYRVDMANPLTTAPLQYAVDVVSTLDQDRLQQTLGRSTLANLTSVSHLHDPAAAGRRYGGMGNDAWDKTQTKKKYAARTRQFRYKAVATQVGARDQDPCLAERLAWPGSCETDLFHPPVLSTRREEIRLRQ